MRKSSSGPSSQMPYNGLRAIRKGYKFHYTQPYHQSEPLYCVDRCKPRSLAPATMSTTMTVTKTAASSPARAGVMDHSIYPPIERFQTIDGVVRSHAAEQEQKPAICYPVSAAADFEEHTPAEVDRYTDITAQYYINQGLQPAVSTGEFSSSADCRIADILPPGSLFGASTGCCTTGRLKFRNYSYISRSKSTWLCHAVPVHAAYCLCICQADGHGQLPQIDHPRKLPASRH